MNTAVQIQEVRIKDVSVTEDSLTAQLTDGRTISVPLAWSWRLSEATPKQRANWEIIGDGQGVHWPILMRTSVPKACFTVFPLPDLEYLRNSVLNQNKRK